MKDSYNREISYMRLSVTDRCNFRCKYCMPDNITQRCDNLTFDEFFNICETAVHLGIKKIRITGGEPLSRQGIVDFCCRVCKLDGLKELTMTTNGSLLSKYAQELKNAGVNRLNISLDTLSESKFNDMTNSNKFSDVIQGIQAAQNAHFDEIKINTVLVGGYNINEISDFVELTKDNDISVRFIELMPMGVCAKWDKSKFIPADIVLKTVPELNRVSFDGVAETYRKDGYAGTVGLIRPLSNKFCDVCNKIRVTSDGKLKTCLHSDDEYNLKGLSSIELEATIKNAILNKPPQHKLQSSCFSETQRFMNQIGG